MYSLMTLCGNFVQLHELKLKALKHFKHIFKHFKVHFNLDPMHWCNYNSDTTRKVTVQTLMDQTVCFMIALKERSNLNHSMSPLLTEFCQ